MTTKKGTGSYFRATTWPRSEYSNRQNKVTPHYVKNKYKFKVSSFVPSADMLNGSCLYTFAEGIAFMGGQSAVTLSKHSSYIHIRCTYVLYISKKMKKGTLVC